MLTLNQSGPRTTHGKGFAMFAKLKERMKKILCHRAAYAGLSGTHVFAALATGKPEVYLPMAVLYLVLVVLG